MIYIKSCPVANRHGRKIMFRREQEENKMELCYDGALVLPSSYAVMDEEEMTYTEGGEVELIEEIKDGQQLLHLHRLVCFYLEWVKL